MTNSYTFVLCIIAIVMGARVIQVYLMHRYKKPEVDTELEDAVSKIDVLEERIRVLERIVTENRFDLKEEINKL